MRELPFSPDIRPFEKPIEVGDTNQIYYDPRNPDVLIRVPIDKEAMFLENDPKLINIAEKTYRRIGLLGKNLDIDVAPHQFILAKETEDGPVKPMLLAERIEGSHLVPIDKSNPKTLDAINRIAELGQRYLHWIESSRPRSVVTDVFRPDQYIVQPSEGRDRLCLVDIEPRLKERERGIRFIRAELMFLVAPLRDSEHADTFRQLMHYALRSLKKHRNDAELASLINIVVNYPEGYQQMSDRFLGGEEVGNFPSEVIERLRNKPLIIDKAFLHRLGIKKI